MKTVMVGFDTTVSQMTEMFQRPNCLRKKMTEISQREKTAWDRIFTVITQVS